MMLSFSRNSRLVGKMMTRSLTIGVGDQQGRQFEDLEVTVDTGSTFTAVPSVSWAHTTRKTTATTGVTNDEHQHQKETRGVDQRHNHFLGAPGDRRGSVRQWWIVPTDWGSSPSCDGLRWSPSLRQPEGQIKRVSHPYARFHHA